MGIYTDTKLETISYGQAGWDKLMNANSNKLETILTIMKVLWDGASKTANQVVSWSGSAWVVADNTIPSPHALTDAADILTDADGKDVFTVTLEGNRAFSNPTNLLSGKTYFWYIKQDAVGNRTATFGASWIFSATPTLSTGVNQIDIVRGIAIGSSIYCTLLKNFEVT